MSQRQDSLDDQLQDLVRIGVLEGMYDAVDYLNGLKLRLKPTTYQTRHPDIVITLRDPEANRWAVVKSGTAVLSKELDFEHEPFPSSRDEAFFERCRYSSLEDAVTYFEKYMKDTLGR